MSAEILILDHVAKTYGNKVVLKNISVTFKSGQVYLICGENGAGKSTLLNIIAGLSSLSLGKIIRNSENVGYLGHSTFIYNGLTAYENLNFWKNVYNLSLDKSHILNLLERVGLLSYAYERAGVFSRGMMQRLNLARLLMLNPDIILMDEPSTGLDIASHQMLHTEIINAKEKGACILMVSHDILKDRNIADMVLNIKNHSIGFFGTINDWE